MTAVRWEVTLWNAYLCTVVTHNVSHGLGGDEVVKAVVQCQWVPLEQEQAVRTAQRSCAGERAASQGCVCHVQASGFRHTRGHSALLTGSAEGSGSRELGSHTGSGEVGKWEMGPTQAQERWGSRELGPTQVQERGRAEEICTCTQSYNLRVRDVCKTHKYANTSVSSVR